VQNSGTPSSSSTASTVEAGAETKTQNAALKTGETREKQLNDKDSIPFLNQPLGVEEAPTGKKAQWADIIWDDKLRVKQRGAL
jgi:hypothetical protein